MISPDFRAGWDAAEKALRENAALYRRRAVELVGHEARILAAAADHAIILADLLSASAPEVTGQAKPSIVLPDGWHLSAEKKDGVEVFRVVPAQPDPETAARERLMTWLLGAHNDRRRVVIYYPATEDDRLEEFALHVNEFSVSSERRQSRADAINAALDAAESAERGKGETP